MSMGTYTLDDVPFDDEAGRWVLSDATKLGTLPPPALTAASIPGVHGSIPVPPSTRDAGSQSIGLIVTDNDAAGAPTGNHQQARDNLSRLLALAAPVGRLPVLRYYPDGDIESSVCREATVRLLAAVEPEMADPYTLTVVLPFDIPGVFWRENVGHDIASAATSTWVTTPPELVGTTGAITDPVFLIAGALNGVTITDSASGKTLTWDGDISAGQWLRVEPAAMTAYRTAAETWTGGTDVSGGLSTGPGGFDLNPNEDMNVSWSLERTGGAGVNTTRARRAFL